MLRAHRLGCTGFYPTGFASQLGPRGWRLMPTGCPLPHTHTSQVTDRALRALFIATDRALSIWWLVRHFLKNLKKLSSFYSKRAPSPEKTEVLHEKKYIFLPKKTTQPRKKMKFCMKK